MALVWPQNKGATKQRNLLLNSAQPSMHTFHKHVINSRRVYTWFASMRIRIRFHNRFKLKNIDVHCFVLACLHYWFCTQCKKQIMSNLCVTTTWSSVSVKWRPTEFSCVWWCYRGVGRCFAVGGLRYAKIKLLINIHKIALPPTEY